LNRYADFLAASQIQVGFKKKQSTAVRSMVLRETIEYYRANNCAIYMRDATKAFNRVYSILGLQIV